MTIKVKVTAEISEPIDAAFAVATNVAQITRWAEIKEVRKLSSNPVKAGTTFQLLSHIGGEDRLIDCKVTVMEPNQKFVYVSGGLARSEVVMDFQPAAHSCTLNYTVSITANTVIELLIRGDVERRARSDVARLVRLIHAAAQDRLVVVGSDQPSSSRIGLWSSGDTPFPMEFGTFLSESTDNHD